MKKHGDLTVLWGHSLWCAIWFNLDPGKSSMYIIYNAAAGLFAPPSEGCLDGNGEVLVCF